MTAALNQRWAQRFIEEVVAQSGAQVALVCPGSRSTALALACAEHPSLRCVSVIDERSAGFVALGVGKASGRPALVLVTSGTAGGHLLPAVMEASASDVPMVVLTADRPWELHDFGAPQTISQRSLYGEFIRRQVQLPAPEEGEAASAHLCALARLGARAALHPHRGPVAFNVPFREPFVPLAPLVEPSHKHAVRVATWLPPTATVSEAGIQEVRERVSHAKRGIIVVGPRDAADGLADALTDLSHATGFPILAEATSQIRFRARAPVVRTYDSLVRIPEFAKAHAPDWVLRFGGGLTSRRLTQWLDVCQPNVVLVQEGSRTHDPSHLATDVILGPAVEVARALMPPSPRPLTAWRESWLSADAIARKALQRALPSSGLSEPRVAQVLMEECGARPVVVASSMPIRDVDAFGLTSHAPRVLANRGANGIDGVISTAVGVGLATGGDVVALVGDLALVHDLGGLLTAKRAGVRLTVVVVNNDGGGIFSFLPLAGTTPHFESLFATPHGAQFESAAQWAGASYALAKDGERLAAVLRERAHGVRVVEVKTQPDTNVAIHEALHAAVAEALSNPKGGAR
ncbi:MAG: 2-succinyl-5-enolpyruvyl-6-hydroxy-3-cyclohexene-1-carboxylic-acid synthase [Myxococcaceae bacterium]